jgi:hypothetical protein
MGRHRFHGDPERFQVIADFVAERYWREVRYVADVAGGQGMLARILAKQYRYEAEVIDPRVWVLRGVKHQASAFDPAFATYYDLIIGLHPDGALREVAQAALLRPAIVVPCCNFWSEAKLGQAELIDQIEQYYALHGVQYERVEFPFKGPKNIGLVSAPPQPHAAGRTGEANP